MFRPIRQLPLLCVALAACHASGAPVAAPEPSVRPGVNERFLAPDLDVEQFVETFEGESREIAARRPDLVAALDLEPGMSVADIGAGTGLFSGDFAAAVGPTGRVLAVEISPGFLTHLRTRFAGRQEITVVEGGERSVELEAGSVDLAWVCDTYHHFEFPRSTLASLHTAIAPGGRLVLVDFERIPGLTRQWLLDHVRAGKAVFRAEVEAAGFRFVAELEDLGLEENYFLVFERP